MSLSPSRQPTYRLRAVTGPAQGERYPIVDHVTFGSDEGNSVRLHDTLVSPAHARVAQQGDGTVWVEDLTGLGATLVNGAAIHRALLGEGARLRIGTTDMIVERASAPRFDTGALEPAPSPLPILLWQTEDIDGRYRIVAKVASGGMGDVYRALHVELDKTVAIKVMKRELGNDPDFVERFKREAVACSHIGQHNIVDISDFGRTSDGRFYFVMEYLEGRTLSELLNEAGLLPVGRAIGICLQIARALAAAHSRGVVHRDLKPDNVIILQRDDRPDFVKVLDFGVAKVTTGTASDAHTTGSGLLMGTPRYMSPEQAATLPVDSRSDIYSLGLILYELVTGRPVFEGETPSLVIAAHIHQPPPSMTLPSDCAPVPERLATLVMQMLRKQPEQRPPSMGDVITALQHVFDARAPAKKELELEHRQLRSRTPFVVVAATMLLGLGALGWTIRTPRLVGRISAQYGPAPAAATPATAAVEPEPVVDEPPAPAPIMVQIDSQPSHATVLEGDAIIGTTPMKLDWEPGRTAQLVFRHDGYAPATRTISPMADVALTVELSALQRRPSSATRSREPLDNLKDVPY